MMPAARELDLVAYLDRERWRVEAALARVLDRGLEGAPAELAEPVRYAVGAGGKRLRPILCVAAWTAVRGRAPGAGSVPASGEAVDGEGGGAPGSTAVPAAVYDLAASLELIHGYSLVHDDLPCMDDDDMRRGRPATHRAFDTAAAAVAGFALIPLACRAVTQAAGSLGLPERTAAALVRELCAGAGAAGMVGGQVSDLEAEGRRIPLAALISLHRRKTGALLTAALRMGGIAAGAAPEQLAALDTYGRAVGLAFQIADDLLDVEGTAEVLGKTAGRDSDLGKATFPGLLGVDEAHRRARTEVDSALAAIAAAGLSSKELEALARFTVERDR